MFRFLIDHLYRYPKSAIKRYRRFGGYINYLRMLQQGNLMKKASLRLPAVHSVDEGAPVYFLTGKKYLYQTLFCIQSLHKSTSAALRFILVDDGTFDDELKEQVRIQLPGARLITAEEIENNLAEKLPAEFFPVLLQKRKVYPHIKKLTDIHTIGANEWKLVLDSDMLFWAEPAELLNWLSCPGKPVYMVDCQQSYGYSNELMSEISGRKIPSLLNVGIIGLNSQSIDWGALQRWIVSLEGQGGTSYYLEQALTAMIIGGTTSCVLPAEAYIVGPSPDKIRNKTGTLHHYVDLSKEGYFRDSWKKI